MGRTLLLALIVAGLQAAPPPDTEIFLAPFSAAGADAGRPAGEHHQQPGLRQSAVVYARRRRHPLHLECAAARRPTSTATTSPRARSTRVTNTPESEYSPTVTPDGAHISVIRVEADGTQRLWRFTLDGRSPELVLTDVKPVGYHAWVDDHTLALFVLGSPATLQLADTRDRTRRQLLRDRDQPLDSAHSRRRHHQLRRSVRRRPRTARRRSLTISELDPKTGRITPLVNAVAGAREADCAWTPDGMLLMADKDVLYGWRRGEGAVAAPRRPRRARPARRHADRDQPEGRSHRVRHAAVTTNAEPQSSQRTERIALCVLCGLCVPVVVSRRRA